MGEGNRKTIRQINRQKVERQIYFGRKMERKRTSNLGRGGGGGGDMNVNVSSLGIGVPRGA